MPKQSGGKAAIKKSEAAGSRKAKAARVRKERRAQKEGR